MNRLLWYCWSLTVLFLGVGFASGAAAQLSPRRRLHCFQGEGEINFADKLKLVQTYFSTVFFFRQAIKQSVIMGLYHEIIKTEKVFFLSVSQVSLLYAMEFGLFPLICGWWLDICSLVKTIKHTELRLSS